MSAKKTGKRCAALLTAFVLALAATLCLAAPAGRVTAGVTQKKAVNDNFDSPELNPEYWSLTGGEGVTDRVHPVTSGGSQLTFKKGGGADTAAVFTKNTYSVPFTLQFDFQSSLESWFGINVLLPSYASIDAAPTYDNVLFGFAKDSFGEQFGYIPPDQVSQDEGQDFLHGGRVLMAKTLGTDNIANIPLRVKIAFRDTGDDIEMDFYMDSLVEISDPTTEKEPDLSVKRATFSGIKGIQKLGATGGNPVTGTGHIGFAPASGNITNSVISNLSIVNGEETLLEDDFSSTKLDASKWEAAQGGLYVKSGTTKALAVNAVTGDKLVSSAAISKKQSDKVFEMRFKAHAERIAGTGSFGVLLGMNDAAAAIDTANTAYVYFKENSVGLKIGGAAPDGVEESAITGLTSDFTEIVLTGYYGGTLAVTVGGTEAAVFADVPFEGSFALTAEADAADNAVSVKIDDFVLMDYLYTVPVTKSLSHNFNVDYFDENDWYMTSEPAGCMTVRDNMLCFDDASDFTNFGTKYTYDDFILRFDLTDIQVKPKGGPNAVDNSAWWIGVSFGKRSYDLGIDFSKLIYFRISVDTEAEAPFNGRLAFSALNFEPDVESEREVPDWFGSKFDPEDPINFKFVAENNTMAVYLKKQSMPAFGQPYIKFRNVETTGAVSLTNTGWATFAVDNFSIVNTGDLYEIPNTEKPAEGGNAGDDNDDPVIIAPPENNEIYYEPGAGGNVALIAGLTGAGALIVGAGATFATMFIINKKKSAK